MRPEQIDKLAGIEEELVDVFVSECKPAKWPGMDKAADRGDRYWHKKNALATLTLVGRIQTVLREIRVDGKGDGKTQPEDEKETQQQEADRLAREGIAILERHRKRRA